MKQRVAVIGWATLIGIMLISCVKRDTGGNVPASINIEGPEWQLVEVGGARVSSLAGEKKPYIMFNPAERKATGFAGCNNFFGSYELKGSLLKFGPIGATRMFCEGLSGEMEMRFIEALEQTRTWELRDGTLLLLKDSEILARFTIHTGNESAMIGELQIIGIVWQWVQTLYNDDRKAVPADPENYTVKFMEDGTLNVKADCNLKGGTYSAERKRLSLKITHSTMAACPEDSLEDEFTRTLSAAVIYFIKDGDLYIDLKYDTGTMMFSKQKEE